MVCADSHQPGNLPHWQSDTAGCRSVPVSPYLTARDHYFFLYSSIQNRSARPKATVTWQTSPPGRRCGFNSAWIEYRSASYLCPCKPLCPPSCNTSERPKRAQTVGPDLECLAYKKEKRKNSATFPCYDLVLVAVFCVLVCRRSHARSHASWNVL